jgi:hypothetical protein
MVALSYSDANTSANAELWVQKGVTTLDAKPLTIAISSNVSKLKADESATITFTLSEVSTDFGKSCCINFSFISFKYKISQYTPCNNYISGVKISGYFA